MSTTIDEKVVEMRFDNKQFESNVADTMSTLDKLKQKLNLTGASKGLEDVQTAARRVDLSGLGNAVETVGLKFNAMYTMADQALRNITTRAQYAAENMVKAFTIDPIKTGFQEYETQINAVQTILANTESKGTTLLDVNQALDTLNAYADKTIYNFTEMTRNIGTFTAAGTDLDTSVNAIQGIANLAAVSGSTSQQASTAMYQLSQALSSGTVKLMDWNSVVNAGMGGQVFQDALKETARVHGIAIDDMIKDQGSFRETLSEGWLTSEILTETLQKFTLSTEGLTEAQIEQNRQMLKNKGYTDEQIEGIFKLGNTATNAATKVKTFTQLMDTLKEAAQSGWTQTWETIVGDFEESKEFYTKISDELGAIIGASAESRNELLSGALDNNWEKLTNKINEAGFETTVFEEKLRSAMEAHGLDVDKLIEEHGSLAKVFKNGAASSDILKEAVDGLGGSLEGLSNIEQTLKKGMKGDDVSEMQKALKALGHDLGAKGVDGSFGKDTQAALKAFQEAQGLEVTGILDETTLESLKKATENIEGLNGSCDTLIDNITELGGRELLIESLWNAFEGLKSVLKPIGEAFREIFPKMQAEQLYNMIQKFHDFTEKLTLSEKASANLKTTFKGLFAILDIVKSAFVAVFNVVKPLFGTVDDLGGGILELTAKFGEWAISLRDSLKEGDAFNKFTEKVSGAFQKIADFIKPVIEGIKEFGKSISGSFTESVGKAEGRLQPLVLLGTFIKSIFVGIGKVIEIIAPYVAKAASAIGGVLKNLMDSITGSIQNADYNKIFDIANGGLITAIGFFIAKFIKSGADILDNASGFTEDIKELLGGVGDALDGFTQSLKADALKKIAVAIGILAASLLVLSFIDSDKLTLSLVAISALFGELMLTMTVFSKIMGDGKAAKSLISISAALVSLSAALLILSVALKIMSTMSWEEMGVGLISMTVGIGALVGAVYLLTKIGDKKLNGVAKVMKKLATSLLILSVALKIMSTMSWEEMGVALISMVVGLGGLVAAIRLLPKDASIRIAGMVGLATALVILAAALKIMATMSWDDIARSLVALAGSMVILVAALNLMKNAVSGALMIKIIAPALVLLAAALKIMASMSWEEIGKGMTVLAGSMLILTIALHAMKKAVTGAAAINAIAPALIVLGVALKIMGSMSWEEIGRGLVALAGAFTVLGLAALLLKPLVGTIALLASSLMLFGVGIAAIGAGILMIGLGVTALAAALAASGGAIVVFVSSLISLIPYAIEQVGVGIIALCEVIAGSGAAICEAASVLIIALVDALVAAVPALVEGVLVLVEELLKALVEHAPVIVAALFDFLIVIIDTLAEKIPELVKAGVNLLMAFFQGVIDALQGIDVSVLIQGIAAVGLLSALVMALAAIAALTPAAMIGVLGLGVVVAELALVLAAIGALAQIPGLEWLIGEGGQLMATIGSAIGQFLGGIIGGFAQGMSSALPQIGSDLSAFMNNAKDFIDGAKSIDSATLDGVKSLVGVILALTGASILEGLTSWFTGGSSLTKFGEELAAFAPSIRTYADTVAGIDATAVEASANAAKALAQMTTYIPNEGGVAAWFAGENSISKFAGELVLLGQGLKAYSLAIVGFDAEAVIASANAAKALADMTSCIPNEGGVAAWFAGENSISKFSSDLVSLGMGLKAYSFAIIGFDAEAVIASANAAKALADMTSCIPNEGGVSAWFAGENSISKFGNDLVSLGMGLKAYSLVIAGFNADAVIASANAAKALVDMTSCIPNEGGVAAWFAGENSISKFGSDLIALGMGLLGFSVAVAGVNIENVTAATAVAKELVSLVSNIPNEGGVVAWFTGENSLSKFGSDLLALGAGLLGFSVAVTGINIENVTAAAGAAKELATLTNSIPNEGGVVAWFTGDNSIATFASNLPALGDGLNKFSSSVEGINAENVTAAAGAAKALAEMTSYVPKEGGIAAWFTGDNSIATFAGNLPTLGEGLKGFSDSVAGIVPENITAAASAARNLAGMCNSTPENSDKLISFGDNIVEFGSDLSTFSTAVTGISGTMGNAIANMKNLIAAVALITSDKVANLKNLGESLKTVGQEAVTSFVNAFTSESAKTSVRTAAADLADKAVDGMESKESTMKDAGESLASKAGSGIGLVGNYLKFYSAGSYLVEGFAAGISANSYKAAAKASAMATAAKQAAEEALGIQSPSKVFYKIGGYTGQGFVNALSDYGTKSYAAGSEMANAAKSGLSKAIYKVQDLLNGTMDTQPTIRPVLDLSDVESGAGAINGMFSTPLSIGAVGNINAVSSLINKTLQNGGNSDVISAIDKLSKKLGNVGNTSYNINGITYDDGSNVAEAINTLVRATKVGGRI